MAREALTLVGGAAGYFLGGPIGAAIGFTVGAALGNMVDPQTNANSGPRLGDLKVQVSTWGVSIPIMWGSMRMAGNVIWAQDLIETANTSSSGGLFGKGGPSSESTTYSYSANMAVALCEGPITGIRKIWANGELIYNISADADNDTISASNVIAAVMKVYPGSETQLADPTIEADKGVGNVPAYRGLAYVVFTGLQLADYGNRIPNLEFEVIKNGTFSYAGASTIGVGSGVAIDPVTGYIWTAYGDGTNIYAKVYNPNTDALIASIDLGVASYTYLSIIYTESSRTFWIGQGNNSFAAGYAISIVDPDSMSILLLSDTDYGGAVDSPGGCLAYNADKQQIYVGISTGISYLVLAVREYDYGNMARVTDDLGVVQYIPLPNWTFSQITMPDISRVAFIGYGNWISIVNTQAGFIGIKLIDLYATGWSSIAQNGRLAYDSKRHKIFWGDNSQAGIYIVDPIALTISLAIATTSPKEMWYDTDEDIIYVDTGTNILLYNPATFALIDTYVGAGIATGFVTGQSVYASSGIAYATEVTTPSTSLLHKYSLGKRLSITTIPLSQVVTDLCLRAGLTAGQIDVTQLTDIVDGYAVIRVSTVRAALLQLQKAYFFDAVESDDKLKFVKRGGNAVSIPFDDIGAYEYGTQSAEPLAVQRIQEVELPQTVNVNFYNMVADYLLATESARRLITTSNQQAIEDLALNLTPAKAAKIADVLMYDAHVGRTSFQFSTSRKYAKYEPTDVFDISSNGINYRIRAIKKEESGSLIKWAGVADDATIINSNATAATQQIADVQISVPGATRAEYLDIPIVQARDNDAGFYVAVGGYKAGWNGSTLYRSVDGVSFTSAGTAANSATLGTCLTILGAWTGENFPDEKNSVTVFLTSGTLSSITYEQLINGENACVIGNEILHFREATLIAANTYTLSGFVRARNGTDQYLNNHSAAERFVLLTVAGTMRPNEGLSGINAERFYKPVSFGASLSQTQAVRFTNTGVGLKPLAPVHVSAVKQLLSAFWNFAWTRCDRVDTAWRDLADVALSEDSESYDIDIINSLTGLVVRTVRITTPSYSYSLANQTTDFGASVTINFSISIYQISAQVGRGFAGSKSF